MSIKSAFLSNPADKPTGFLNLIPMNSCSRRGDWREKMSFVKVRVKENLPSNLPMRVIDSCTRSGSCMKRIGFANTLYRNSKIFMCLV